MSESAFEFWLGAHFPSDDAPGGVSNRSNSPDWDSSAHAGEASARVIAGGAELSSEDRALVAAIALGDIDKFTQWYSDLYTDACRFAYRFFDDRDQAADIVQDVFLSIWERRARWSISIAPRAYVLGAIRRRALHVLRHNRVVDRQTREHKVAYEVPGLGNSHEMPDAATSSEMLEAIMRVEIAKLPERQRTALTLRWEYGMSNTEIAHTLGVGEAAVSRVLARAVQTLRETWDRILGAGPESSGK